MKILYVGCVESSYLLLKKLIEAKAEIVGVITKEKSLYNSDYKSLEPLCEQYNIPYIFINNINDEDSLEFVKKTKPEMVYCLGWSQLIGKQFADLIPKGIIGFHPAALPNNRGRHPIIWALVLGLKQTASSFFMIDQNADTGDVVSQETIQITYEDDAGTLYKKIMEKAEVQVVRLWESFENNTVVKIPQIESEGNSWRKRGKCDGQIDWRMSSRSIYNLVRGLTKPYVGAHMVVGGKEIKVWKVKEIITNEYDNIEPGKVLQINSDYSIDIKAGSNIIRLITFEPFSISEGEYL